MGLLAFLNAKLTRSRATQDVDGSIYDFKIKDINNNNVDFSVFAGKNLLIVNTASRCGYTPQYADLEQLHQTHGDLVTVIGFPANNFLWQEPGTDQEIASFCQKNYGVTFRMFSKISVKGKGQHPLYRWLRSKTGKIPSWNFCKYLVNENGTAVTFFDSNVNPMDSRIIDNLSQKS